MESVSTTNDPSMSELEHCFIRVPNSKRLRITAAGQELFAKRFAKQGFNIESIKSSDEFLRALNVTTMAEINAVRCDRNSEPALKELLARVFD